ncbi:FtsK/SpoIIIE domain-containing protein [Nocardia jiangsuensis]|uniref:FtsK/SpoIIIE domain-containing protein n=1 Tax=Nocardia jiangsuensis TaxID=1691563 RepID=A0ABV8E3Q4_9NOCA
MTLETLLVATGAVTGTGVLAWWRYLDATTLRPTTQTAEQITAAAPPALRPAAFILSDPAQSNLMFEALELGHHDRGFPHIARWDYTPHGIDVEVQMLGGQKLGDWTSEDTTETLATYFAVPSVTAVGTDPSHVRLSLRVFDTLTDSIPTDVVSCAEQEAAPEQQVTPESVGVDLEAVPVGVAEDGSPWLLRVLGSQILVAGATGSGKGSVLHSIIGGLGPAIRAGLVDVWMCDPKGGAEFGSGADRLFVRFGVDAATILGMLSEAVELMDERLVRMRRSGTRKLYPTTDEPLMLIVIDEAAALSSYASREEQNEFRRLSGLLLSKGRAAAVVVVAALQDPSKETMPNRQLFSVRIGLRLDEPTQTAMVHGQGARDRGARCDQISELTPGVGYVGEDGTTGFKRVRAFWVSDDAVDAIVDAFSPAGVDTAPAADYSGFDPDDLGDGNTDHGPVAA